MQITIILYQQLPGSRFSKIFARTADILLLLHFVSDPYIYVLLRKSRKKHSTLSVLLRKFFPNKQSNHSTRQTSFEDEFNRINLVSNNINDNNISDSNNIINNNNNTSNNCRHTSSVCFLPAGQISEGGRQWKSTGTT